MGSLPISLLTTPNNFYNIWWAFKLLHPAPIACVGLVDSVNVGVDLLCLGPLRAAQAPPHSHLAKVDHEVHLMVSGFHTSVPTIYPDTIFLHVWMINYLLLQGKIS